MLLFDYLVFYRPFLGRIREVQVPQEGQELPRHASAELMRRIGALAAHGDGKAAKRSSFTRFDTAKEPGGVRICCFGDSFTHGHEVGVALDYPSLLQELARGRGMRQVEVLNFGANWHGFQQSHMIWEALAPPFQCDVTLLGPSGFQPSRDLTFQHARERSPYYLHARYVIDGEGVRRIDVDGDGTRERFDRYWAFLPGWRYLRFDRQPPAMLAAALPRGRWIQNPLYYRSDAWSSEAAEIQRRLLGAMAGSGMPIVVGHREADVVSLAASVEGVRAFAVTELLGFPHLAMEGHHSSFGNLRVAEEFLATLAGVGRVRELVTSDVELPPQVIAPTLRLGELDAVEVRGGGRAIGHFIVARGGEMGFGGARGPRVFSGGDRISLLAIVPEGRVLLDAAFVALPAALETGPLILEASGRSFDLGPVRMVASPVPFGVVRVAGLEFGSPILGMTQQQLVLDATRLDGPPPADGPAVLMVGSLQVLRGEVSDGRVVFRHGLHRIRVPREAFVPLRKLAGEGAVALHFRKGEMDASVQVGRLGIRIEPAPRVVGGPTSPILARGP